MSKKEASSEINPEFEKKVAYIDGVPFIFDYHDITDSLMEFINENDITLLTGEFNSVILPIFLEKIR